MAVGVAIHDRVEPLDVGHALRAGPDQGHVAGHDVQELRKLVQRVAAQEAAEPGGAVVARSSVCGLRLVPVQHGARPTGIRLAVLGAVARHGAELQNLEHAPVAPDTRLAMEDRAAHGQPYRSRHDRERREQDQRHRYGHHTLDEVFDPQRDPHGVFEQELDERDAAEPQRARPGALDLEQARHDRDADTERSAPARHREQFLIGRRRERDDDLRDALFGDDPLELVARAEHWQVDAAGGRCGRVGVDEPDRLEAKLGPLPQPARHQMPNAPGTDDQRRAGRAARASATQADDVKDRVADA